MLLLINNSETIVILRLYEQLNILAGTISQFDKVSNLAKPN